MNISGKLLQRIKDQTKLKIFINNIEIQGMVNTVANFNIISPKSWPADWPLQEVYNQFQGVKKHQVA